MLVSCNCFNVGILLDEVKHDGPVLVSDFDEDILQENNTENVVDSFFCSPNREKLVCAAVKTCFDGSNKTEKLSAFVEKRAFGSWSIKRCLLCDTDVYASSISCPGRVYINSALILNAGEVLKRKNLPNYSPAFEILLPNVVVKGTADNEGTTLPPILVHSINQVVMQKLRNERCALEQHIQAFAEQERVKFDQYKSKAKADEAILLHLMAQKAFSPSALLINAAAFSAGGADTRLGGVATPIDELYDSGVPVSPISLQSAGGYSPGSNIVAQKQVSDAGAIHKQQVNVSIHEGSQNLLTGKPSLLSTKRKRHSGGKGKPPSLNDRWYKDQLQEVFSLEEQDDNDEAMDPVVDCCNDQFDENYAADESSDSDNFQKITAMAIQQQQQLPTTPGVGHAQLCRSLPVAIVVDKNRRWAGAGAALIDDPYAAAAADDDDEQHGGGGGNLAESMMALSRSIRPRDDPETLFGNRPNRRRFRSSVDQHAAAPAPSLEPLVDVEFF